MNKQRGSSTITMPITLIVGVIAIVSVIMVAIQSFIPFIYYQKLDNVATKYVFVIEKFGYLTASEKDSLLRDLEKQGINTKNISLIYPSSKKEYGSLIEFEINYLYKYKVPEIINRKLKINEKETVVSVKKNSFSKIY